MGLANAQRFLVGLANNELDEVVHLLSDQVVYTVPGHMPISGTFRGPDQVKEHLNQLLAFSRSTFDVLKWVDWLVGETHVAVLQYAQIQAHGIRLPGAPPVCGRSGLPRQADPDQDLLRGPGGGRSVSSPPDGGVSDGGDGQAGEAGVASTDRWSG